MTKTCSKFVHLSPRTEIDLGGPASRTVSKTSVVQAPPRVHGVHYSSRADKYTEGPPGLLATGPAGFRATPGLGDPLQQLSALCPKPTGEPSYLQPGLTRAWSPVLGDGRTSLQRESHLCLPTSPCCLCSPRHLETKSEVVHQPQAPSTSKPRPKLPLMGREKGGLRKEKTQIGIWKYPPSLT